MLGDYDPVPTEKNLNNFQFLLMYHIYNALYNCISITYKQYTYLVMEKKVKTLFYLHQTKHLREGYWKFH